jgi:hypothetical protein
MKVEFVGQSARDQSNQKANPSRLINGYREPLVAGGKSRFVIRAVPGMDLFATIPGVFLRDMNFETGARVACGGNLYTIGVFTGSVQLRGAIVDSEFTSMAENNGDVAIAAGGDYFVDDAGTGLTGPLTTGAITDAGSVGYLGGYTLVSELNGRKVQWSALVDPTTFNATHFASAEITTDPIIRLIVFKDTVYIFKAAGFERWGLTGGSGPNAFARIDGAQTEPGLKAFGLITQFPNGFAYVSSDGKVMAFVGGQLTPISTPPVEVALAENEPDRMFYYEVRGHGFICVAFSDVPAWCYDTATGEWHERSQDDGPWTVRASAKTDDGWIVGTNDGRLALLTADCLDFDQPLVRRYVSRTLAQPERVTINKIEAFPRVGLDLQGKKSGVKGSTFDSTPAKVDLRTSKDGGFTWSAPKSRDVGTVGAYATRLTWRALGQFRDATIELSQSSVVDVPLLAEIELDAS